MKGIKVPVFTRMNLDVDVRGLKAGEYRRLINGINISPFGLEALDGVISNIVGNELVENANLQATSTVLGALEDPANNRCFFFVLHSGNNHTIYQYNGSAIVIVMRTALFAFNTAAGMVFSATIVGDELIFSDNTSEIKMINVAKAIAGVTYTPTLEEIVLIKRPPQLPLTLATVADGAVASNYVYKHYFQFYYRYIYTDNESSVFSALSIVDRPEPVSETSHNAIDVTIQASEVIPNTVKQIDYAVRVDGSNEFIIYRQDFPVAGALASRTHRFYNTELTETLADGVSLKWNDSVPKKSTAVKFFENRLFCLNNTEGYDYSVADIAGAVLSTASGSSDGRGSKGRGIYPVGLMFFDNYGRHAGVNRIGEVRIPERNYNTAINRYNIQWDLTAVAQAAIPTWATHYAVVIGEIKNIAWFLQDQAADLFSYDVKPDGTEIFQNAAIPSKYLAVDITGLSQNNIGYTFNEGDRIILYGVDTTPTQAKIDLRVVRQSGRFVITERNDFDLGDYDAAQHESSFTPVFEIYREKISVGEIYSEIGKKFAITSPGGGARAFSSLTGTYEGDIEKYARTAWSYDNGTYSATDPYSNLLEAVGAAEFEKMNAYDDNFSKWVKGTGRSIARLSVGSKEIVKKNVFRFGQEYFLNSSLNQVATFEALDEQALPSEGGAGMALAESGKVLVALQYAQTIGIYVGEAFVNTTNGNNFLTKTDKVIGDVNKNLADHGCQNPNTVVCREGRVYYLDLRRGCVVRRSQDGLTRISDYGMRSFFANMCRIYRENISAANQRIIAGWDPKYECYVISFLNVADPATGPNATVYFYEKTNSWVAFAVYFPEFFGTFGTRQLHFSAGGMWIQTNNTNFNNWFGTQLYRTLNVEVGGDSEEKIWTGIEVDIDTIYTPATPTTLKKILAPSSWSDISTFTPDPTYGATTITKTGWVSGIFAASQAMVIPPGGTIKFSFKVQLTLSVAAPSGIDIAIALVASPTQQSFNTGPLLAGTYETVIAVELQNELVVNSSTLTLAMAGVVGSIDFVFTLPAGQVVYTTLSSNEDVILLYHTKDGTLQTRINFRDFSLRASAWFSSFFRSLNDPNFVTVTESKYKSSQKVRGQSAYITISGRSTGQNMMKSVTVFYEHSPLTYP